MTKRVCLIVDNPLRDLDGLVLLAWQIAQQGGEAWLVPMYDQGFDVFAIQPDWVIANYVRPNNIDLLKLYRSKGISICILDTEGAGGKTADEFAEMVEKSGGLDLVDLYCVWGNGQFDALRRRGKVAAHALHLTGCPRYDFCADPWRDALPKPAETPGYILVNTNFPVVNPRFSQSAADERNTMIQAGFSPDFADAYIHDAKLAHRGMIDLLAKLLERYPAQRFVLRPHPFESIEAYQSLTKWSNFNLRQEGTSIEWINHAALLLHLNCSTAVEAVLLEKEPVSPAWLDTPALRVPGPHNISHHAQTVDELCALIEHILEKKSTATLPDLSATRQSVIAQVYHAIDGRSAGRVADAIFGMDVAPGRDRAMQRPSPRGSLVYWTRRLLGYRCSAYLRKRFKDSVLEQRRLAKRFSVDEVSTILDRLSRAVGEGKQVVVRKSTEIPGRRFSHLTSGNAVRISATADSK